MTTLRLSPVFIALSLIPSFALAAPAGTVLFSRGDVQIIDVKGKPRPAIRGAELQDGERIVAPPGTVSQVKMIDGSLFGVRPDTEFKVELPAQASDKAKQTISLIKGGLRVINIDMRDGKKREPITLQTGASVVQLVNGDMESFFVRPDTGKTKSATESGSYTRLITGTGSVRSGSFVVPLAIQTIAFVPKTDVAPVTTTTVAPTMFITPTFTTSLSTLSTTSTTSTTTSTISPTLSTSTISPTLSTSTLSTSTLSTSSLSTSTSSLTTTLSPTTSTLTSPTLLTSTTLLSPTTSTYIAPTTSLSTSTLSTTSLTSPTLAVTSPTLTTITYTPPKITYVAPIYTPPPTTVTCKTCTTYIIKR